MRKLSKNKIGSVQMVASAVAILVTVAIAILVFFNIAASVDPHTLDTSLQSTISNTGAFYAENATNATLAQSETFFTIAPLIVVVLAAVIILSYVSKIGVGGR